MLSWWGNPREFESHRLQDSFFLIVGDWGAASAKLTKKTKAMIRGLDCYAEKVSKVILYSGLLVGFDQAFIPSFAEKNYHF